MGTMMGGASVFKAAIHGSRESRWRWIAFLSNEQGWQGMVKVNSPLPFPSHLILPPLLLLFLLSLLVPLVTTRALPAVSAGGNSQRAGGTQALARGEAQR